MENNNISEGMQEIVVTLNKKTKAMNDKFTCQFIIEKEGEFYIDLSLDDEKMRRGVIQDPQVILSSNFKTFQGLINGTISPMVALTTRKIKIEGDLMKLSGLASLINR